MTGTRTFYGNVPASYRRWWLEHRFPVHAARLGGVADGGGILEPVTDAADPELDRLRRFGVCWSWWSVSDAERDQWRALG
jgi:hypothetical protein